MIKIITFFVFFTNFFNLVCNEIETISYNGKKLNISSKISILNDTTKNIKEENIVKGLYDDKFEPYYRNILCLRNDNAVYYVKIVVKNISSSEKINLYGWFGLVTLNRTAATCFYLNNNKIIENKFTRKINKEDKESLLNYGHACFDILPNETKTIYMKVNNFLTTPLILTELENIIKEERIYFLIASILSGMSLIVLVIILIIYLKLKRAHLLYYILMIMFTYLKSNLFFRFLRNYVSIKFSYKIYAILFVFYIFSLVHFVISVLRLNKAIERIKIKSYLISIKYGAIFIGITYLLNFNSHSYFIQSVRYIYLITFILILYAAIKRYRDDWIFKVFFFGLIPNLILYTYGVLNDEFKLNLVAFDVRINEFIEIFANLFLIALIFVYDVRFWKDKNTVEDQEELIKVVNGADNLMHGLLTLIHSYKHDINFSRVMFFRRKVDRENESILYYDFSVPLTLTEREEEKKYFNLAKQLRKDKFNEYYICDDIQSSEIYRSLLPGYKSMIALRLKFVEGGDLGYIVVLNNSEIEYEYDEVVRDFKYKSSLLVQYFKTIDDIREKYGAIIVEETLRNFHMEVLRDAGKDVADTLGQLDKIKTISNKYIVDNDPSIKRIINLFYDNLEKLMISIKKNLQFDNPDKKTKNKIMFTYSIIEEMLNYLDDIVRKNSNKINIKKVSQIDSDYELYGHVKIIRSIINHYLAYIYDRIIKNDMEVNITITTSLVEGKLKIDTKIEGFYLSVDDLRKEYNNEVHKILLSSVRSKLELNSDNNGVINIIYLLNLLTKEEKKKFNIDHLDYDDADDENF